MSVFILLNLNLPSSQNSFSGVNMFELNQSQYTSVKHFLKDIKCDIVYGYSIIENRQKGRIFVDEENNPQTVLFWHYNSFAFISGRTDNDDFNNSLYKLLCGTYEENQRKFILLINDIEWNNTVQNLIKNQVNVSIIERLRFKFNKKEFQKINVPVPNGYTLSEIDENLIYKLQGRIIPSYSWHSPEAFLKFGKGYCLLDGDKIACNAFSSSIGNQIIDIGIETMADYRMKGLALPTAHAMVKYCLENGFEPGWGCNAVNIGSARIAQSLGFEIIDSHSMYVQS